MFKQCSVCSRRWRDREDFLADPGLEIIGYQVFFEEIKDGLFLFNHTCKTTLALKVAEFDDLYKGQKPDTVALGTDTCSGYCLDMTELKACNSQCKYAYVRDIIQVIRKWPKE
jgi:hypothetical protein